VDETLDTRDIATHQGKAFGLFLARSMGHGRDRFPLLEERRSLHRWKRSKKQSPLKQKAHPARI
jgi:hypothetical protein